MSTHLVAPRAGAWIEIYHCYTRIETKKVAPRVGTCVEILKKHMII